MYVQNAFLHSAPQITATFHPDLPNCVMLNIDDTVATITVSVHTNLRTLVTRLRDAAAYIEEVLDTREENASLEEWEGTHEPRT